MDGMTTTDAIVRIDDRPEAPGRLTIEAAGRYSWDLEVELDGLELGQREWVAVDAGGSTYVGEAITKSAGWNAQGVWTTRLMGASRLAQMDKPA